MMFKEALRALFEESGVGILRDSGRFRSQMIELCGGESDAIMAFLSNCDDELLYPYVAACQQKTAFAIGEATQRVTAILSARQVPQLNSEILLAAELGDALTEFLGLSADVMVPPGVTAPMRGRAAPVQPMVQPPARSYVDPAVVSGMASAPVRRARMKTAQDMGRTTNLAQRRASNLPIVIAVAVAGIFGGLAAWMWVSQNVVNRAPVVVDADVAASTADTASADADPSTATSSSTTTSQNRLSSQDDYVSSTVESDSSSSAGELSSATFAKHWSGSYEGHSYDTESGVIKRSLDLRFDRVDSNGSLSGTCSIGVSETGDGAGTCSYRVEGSVDWKTGEFECWGTSWINQGDFRAMRRFQGKLSAVTQSISGTSTELNGDNEGALYLKAS